MDWLPETCAYRLRANGEPLPRLALSDFGKPRDASTKRGSRRAAGRSAKSMRGTILNFMSSSARSKELAVHPDLPVPVEIHPVRSARRLRLRFDERRGVLKLTCPIRTSRRAALAWAAEQRAWVETQIADIAAGRAVRSRRDGADRRARHPAGVGAGEAAHAAPGRRRAALRRAREPRSRGASRPSSSAGRSTRCRSETAADRRRGRRHRRARSAVGDANTRWGSCSAERRDPLQLAADPRARRPPAAMSSRTKSPTSSTSIMGRSSGSWRRACSPSCSAATSPPRGPIAGRRAAAEADRARGLTRLRLPRRRRARHQRGWLRRLLRRRRGSPPRLSTSSSHWLSTPVPSGRMTPAAGSGGWPVARLGRQRIAVGIDQRRDSDLDRRQAPHFLVGLELPVGHRHFGLELLDRAAWPPRPS